MTTVQSLERLTMNRIVKAIIAHECCESVTAIQNFRTIVNVLKLNDYDDSTIETNSGWIKQMVVGE